MKANGLSCRIGRAGRTAAKVLPGYCKHHLLVGVQSVFAIASNQQDKVPAPSATLAGLADADPIINQVVAAYNSALEGANTAAQESGEVFSPQNWLKAKDSLTRVRDAMRMYHDAAQHAGWKRAKATSPSPRR